MSQVNEEIKYVIPLTDRRLRFDSVADDFFQMVGNVPFFKFLFMPFIGNASVKQSLVKCSEHTANFPTGLRFFRCMDTKLFHFNLTLPRRIMNRNSQLFVLYVSTVLNNTTATRHNFVKKEPQKASKNISPCMRN